MTSAEAYVIFLPLLSTPTSWLVEVLVPPLEVLDRREHGAVADLLPVRHLDPEGGRGRLLLLIARGTIGDDPRVQLVELRVPHPEGHEDVLGGELAQRLPARALHDDAEEEEAGVAVEVLLAGREVDALLPRDDVERVLLRGPVLLLHPRELHRDQVVPQAARVVEEMADRDRLSGHLAVVRNLRQPLADVVVERELALARQELDREGRELLGGRADVEDGLGGVRDAELEVRHAVAARVDDPAVAVDAERAARRVASVVFGEDRVDLRLRVGLRRGSRRRSGRGRRGDEDAERERGQSETAHEFSSTIS
jgi:hypothetical protein